MVKKCTKLFLEKKMFFFNWSFALHTVFTFHFNESAMDSFPSIAVCSLLSELLFPSNKRRTMTAASPRAASHNLKKQRKRGWYVMYPDLSMLAMTKRAVSVRGRFTVSPNPGLLSVE